MANLVKLRYSHAYKCEIFSKSGVILPVYLEDSTIELNPSQRKKLLYSIPVQNSILSGEASLDFSGEIFSYKDSEDNTKTFTFEATSSEVYAELLVLTEKFELFMAEMERDLLAVEHEEILIQDKIRLNREKYLNKPENALKLDWINQKFFDAETIFFIFKCRGECI